MELCSNSSTVGYVAYIFPFIKPFVVELFIYIFHSFKAGITNAIYTLQLRKICIFMKNGHLQKLIICLTNNL